MKDNVINVLKNCTKAVDIFELQNLLGIDNVESAEELSSVLRQLEDEV